MLPLLQPRFPLGLAIACAALWCALAIGAVLGRGGENSAPTPPPGPPQKTISRIIRADRIGPVLAFDDRWQSAAPAMHQAVMAEVIQPAPKRGTAAQIKPQRAKRHADRVCGSKAAAISVSGGICRGGAGDERGLCRPISWKKRCCALRSGPRPIRWRYSLSLDWKKAPRVAARGRHDARCSIG